MSRIHLFEFEDQPWFPSLIRQYMTDYLNFTASLTTMPFEGFAQKLKAAMQSTGDQAILDLCSGGGGPTPQVIKILRDKEQFTVQAKLSDYFPNTPALERTCALNPGVAFIAHSVDATQVPRELTGFRTIMNAFHHFNPEMARKILQDAATSNRGIAVLELVSRSVFGFSSMLTMLIGMAIFTPFIRPFRVSRLLLTYIFPVVPLFSLWDGIVSCLRIYSPEELKRLTDSVQAPPGYTWDIGRIGMPKGPGFVTYLIGKPASSDPSAVR